MTDKTYPKYHRLDEPTHWLKLAGDLEVQTGFWFHRSWDKSKVKSDENPYYYGYPLQVKDARSALKMAYPDKTFNVHEHGSEFGCARLS